MSDTVECQEQRANQITSETNPPQNNITPQSPNTQEQSLQQQQIGEETQGLNQNSGEEEVTQANEHQLQDADTDQQAHTVDSDRPQSTTEFEGETSKNYSAPSNPDEPDGEKLGLPVPPVGTELFLGGLSKDVTEDDIRRAFAVSGKIFSIRIVADRVSQESRGFGFVTFMTKESARNALRDHHERTEICGRVVRVTMSESKSRLFLGSLPRDMQRSELEQLLQEDGRIIRSIEWLPDAFNPKRNRGFAFVEFASHQDATQALKRFQRNPVQGISASWAEPKDEVDDQTMETVRTVYVRNLPTSFTEEELREVFQPYGQIEKIVLPAASGQKWKNFGFVYFENRRDALRAIEETNQKPFQDRVLDVSLARPLESTRSSRGRGGHERGGRGGGRGGRYPERGYPSSRYEPYPMSRSRYDTEYMSERDRFHDYPHPHHPDPYVSRREPRYGDYAPPLSFPPRPISPPPPLMDPYHRGPPPAAPQQVNRPVYYSPATGQYVTTDASGQLVPLDYVVPSRHPDHGGPPPPNRYESRYERGPNPPSLSPRFRPY